MADRWGPYIVVVALIVAVFIGADRMETRGAELAKACMQSGGTPEMNGSQFKGCAREATR